MIWLSMLLGCAEEPEQSGPQGPEPTVWIGLAEDIGEGSAVNWAYPS